MTALDILNYLENNSEYLSPKEELACIGIRKLETRFRKINSEEYCLSYSAGRDSELVRWFIKNILHDNFIKIVSVNTLRDHSEVRRRMYKYADVVLLPLKPMEWIKENFGIPCFTKRQDEMICRYQRGSRAPHTMSWINPERKTKFKLNEKAKELLLSGELHKVSDKCCFYTKKEPLRLYQEQHGLKPIICTRGSESITRKTAFQTCLNEKGEFRPAFDFSDETVDAIYEVFKIDDLEVYNVLDRTGCAGCPYGLHGGNTEKELNMLTPSQARYAVKSFYESYDVLGIKYDHVVPQATLPDNLRADLLMKVWNRNDEWKDYK